MASPAPRFPVEDRVLSRIAPALLRESMAYWEGKAGRGPGIYPFRLTPRGVAESLQLAPRRGVSFDVADKDRAWLLGRRILNAVARNPGDGFDVLPQRDPFCLIVTRRLEATAEARPASSAVVSESTA